MKQEVKRVSVKSRKAVDQIFVPNGETSIEEYLEVVDKNHGIDGLRECAYRLLSGESLIKSDNQEAKIVKKQQRVLYRLLYTDKVDHEIIKKAFVITYENARDYHSKRRQVFPDHYQSAQKKANTTHWGKNTSACDPEAIVTIMHGGGYWYLHDFIAGRTQGYPLERGGNGIQVHPAVGVVHRSWKSKTYYDRSEYYAHRGCLGSLDKPAEFVGKIKAKYIDEANNGYEGGLRPENIKYLESYQIDEITPISQSYLFVKESNASIIRDAFTGNETLQTQIIEALSAPSLPEIKSVKLIFEECEKTKDEPTAVALYFTDKTTMRRISDIFNQILAIEDLQAYFKPGQSGFNKNSLLLTFDSMRSEHYAFFLYKFDNFFNVKHLYPDCERFRDVIDETSQTEAIVFQAVSQIISPRTSFKFGESVHTLSGSQALSETNRERLAAIASLAVYSLTEACRQDYISVDDLDWLKQHSFIFSPPKDKDLNAIEKQREISQDILARAYVDERFATYFEDPNHCLSEAQIRPAQIQSARQYLHDLFASSLNDEIKALIAIGSKDDTKNPEKGFRVAIKSGHTTFSV